MKKLALSTLIASAVFAPQSMAELGLGLTATYSPNVYKGLDSQMTPFPLVSYDSGRFYIEGIQAGYRLKPKGSPTNIVFFAQYDQRALDASESDNKDIKKLDDRDDSILSGVAFTVNSKAGDFRLVAGSDIGAVHNGLYGEARYSYHIPMGAMGLIPAVGYSFNSENLNEHLYGVSSAESARTGGRIRAFKPGWSGESFVGITGYMYLSRQLRLTGGIRCTSLDSELADSPIVDKTHSIITNVGISYTF